MRTLYPNKLRNLFSGMRCILWVVSVMLTMASIMLHTAVFAQGQQDSNIIRLDIDIPFQYHPRAWGGYYYAECGDSPPGPDSIRYTAVYFYGELPFYGYPYHRSLIAGLNDTLQASVVINNRADEPFPLAGTKYEQWYAPCVYTLSAVPGFPPLRDSTELGYRIRGWYSGAKKAAKPDTIPPHNDWYSLVMDIWNLPEGLNQVCLLPTESVPKDIRAMAEGYVFQYYPPQSLADTINAYEGCFWRAYYDKNFVGAGKWVDKILSLNPTAVPGWWLKADLELQRKDTAASKEALDKALAYFNAGADPAMPDSTKRPLTLAEEDYRGHVQVMLNYDREQLGP